MNHNSSFSRFIMPQKLQKIRIVSTQVGVCVCVSEPARKERGGVEKQETKHAQKIIQKGCICIYSEKVKSYWNCKPVRDV